MKITIIASGSRGDVQPYIALGKGLIDAGEEVRFVTHENFRDLAEAQGLNFWTVEGDVQQVAQSQEMQERIEKGNFLMLMAQMAKEAKRGAIYMAEAALEACRGVDLILGGLGGAFTGAAVAEKLKLPLMQAYYVPFTPTREFSGALVPDLPPLLGAVANRLTHQLTRQMLWQGFRTADKAARQQVLNLPAAPFWGPYHAMPTQGMPVLYGYSPSVIPTPSDWDAHIHATGYWFLEAEDGWMPPADLTAFLETGPAPVYVGFGSMSSRKPAETAELIIAALQQIGQRAILLSGWGGLQKSDLPESIFMVDSVPHDWLFPRMAAVVHHGGAGTTGAGFRSGVPSVIIPFFGDQSFWGRRAAALGVGPTPIPRKKLTVDRLAQAIHSAVMDVSMRQRASELGAKIRSEDGLARAVEIITNLKL